MRKREILFFAALLVVAVLAYLVAHQLDASISPDRMVAR
jgi:hypothetical protein